MRERPPLGPAVKCGQMVEQKEQNFARRRRQEDEERQDQREVRKAHFQNAGARNRAGGDK